MNTDTHIPVLLREAIDALAIREHGRYADGTYGRGGHSQAILRQLGPDGGLMALDRDPAAAQSAALLCADPRFAFYQANFTRMAELAKEHWNGQRLDGAILDLGMSSPQIDSGERGFSFSHNGPLDMRMNPAEGVSAAQWLQQATEQEIADVLWQLGEERYGRRIARAIVAARATQPLAETQVLAELIRRVVPRVESGRHPATRAFQAIRIHINQELESLRVWLDNITQVLQRGARLVVISFHSLEDRLVKRRFQGRVDGQQPRLPRGLPVMTEHPPREFRLVGKPLRPAAEECQRNPRARSAVMRVAEYCG